MTDSVRATAEAKPPKGYYWDAYTQVFEGDTIYVLSLYRRRFLRKGELVAVHAAYDSDELLTWAKMTIRALGVI